MTPNTGEELMYATPVCSNSSGKRDVAAIVKNGTQTAPTPATKIKKNSSSVAIFIHRTALFVNGNMTKRKYVLIRKEAKQRWCKIYPSSDVLEKEKATCFPVEYFSV
jgi:hypothetical protein